MNKRVLLITTLYSPFQVNIVHSFEKIQANCEYHVAFTVLSSKLRGKHWCNNDCGNNKFVHLIDKLGDSTYQLHWLDELIKKINPDVIILGQWRGDVARFVKVLARQTKVTLGYWLEPPNFLLPKLIQFILKRYSYYKMRDANFCFAIGDRCEFIYRRILNKNNKVFLLPYGQDLTDFYNINQKTFEGKITFLFSGQLIKRHNIKWICSAIIEIYNRYPNDFSIVIAANGPEQKRLDDLIQENPSLKNIINYDRQYSKWSDRVRPFSLAHVLIYPTSHSGWGLVIPEAMAAGLVVLSTRKAESARYFLRHDINGREITHSKAGLVKGMEYCLLNRSEMARYSLQARVDAYYGTDSFVAKRLDTLLGKVVHCESYEK